jgi:hypothetical protein
LLRHGQLPDSKKCIPLSPSIPSPTPPQSYSYSNSSSYSVFCSKVKAIFYAGIGWDRRGKETEDEFEYEYDWGTIRRGDGRGRERGLHRYRNDRPGLASPRTCPTMATSSDRLLRHANNSPSQKYIPLSALALDPSPTPPRSPIVLELVLVLGFFSPLRTHPIPASLRLVGNRPGWLTYGTSRRSRCH